MVVLSVLLVGVLGLAVWVVVGSSLCVWSVVVVLMEVLLVSVRVA